VSTFQLILHPKPLVRPVGQMDLSTTDEMKKHWCIFPILCF